MNEEKLNQKEILYNPKNWTFIAFFLGPILPAILYYRNCKLLGETAQGKKVLVGTIIFVLIFLVAATIFSYYSILIILVETIIAVIIAEKLAKTQLQNYEKMKEEMGLRGGRNEAALILLFLAIWITLAFGLPYVAKNYIKNNHTQFKYGDKNIYLLK
ncbi:MAG: hypothetical protein A3J93_03035 [Candidatus Magasanikbacteria bacterium RIFOXYC2_FULL_42_28]|uniref:Uncharacterized protein n=1 Tax=Candidatus Magasanikbacteria bacterium RIFOXYC2_FULL_42_28 TaxID=1798704 RepID=A0A1F6NU63_9BACT|nr:MAG: hypothetical protein A3J93_03035 [Candidatus Magasanikbacteria bacterium RIFOXYC2_FULL_42_28]